MSRRLIVLAGGLGSRLSAAVGGVPKILAPVNGRPFVSLLLQKWSIEGVERLTFLLYHQAGKIKQEVDELVSEMNLDFKDVSYVVEKNKMGTGGAVANYFRGAGSECEIIVSNADTWIEGGIREMLTARTNSIGLVKVADSARFGRVVHSDGFVSSFYEKSGNSVPAWINAGIYSLDRATFLDYSPEGSFSIETDFFPSLIKNKDLGCVTLSSNRFIDIGIPEDYELFCEMDQEGVISDA